MRVYVDPPADHGRTLRGEPVLSCHLFTDAVDLQELHRIADLIGCRPEWFQGSAMPHYVLTATRRQEAIGCGAVPVTRTEALEVWRRRRAAVDAIVRSQSLSSCNGCPANSYCRRLQRCARAT